MAFTRKLKPNHLRLIVKIAETGKLQIAADTVGMSQPAASRVLSDIESDTGTALFSRTAKGMYPTRAGVSFLRHARSILASFSYLESEVQGVAQGLLGEVKVGAVTGPAAKNLVPAILRLSEAAPGIELTIEVAPSSELVSGLERGRFDFVLARLPAGYDSRAFQILPAQAEVVTLLVRKSHPLAERETVRLDELSEFGWVSQERGSPIREAVEQTMAQAGVRMPGRIINSSSLLVMIALLEQSDVIATVAEEAAALLVSSKTGAGLTPLNVSQRMTVSPYFIIFHREHDLSSAAERLLREILKTFDSPSPNN